MFISHSYKDSEAHERLLAMLPKSVEPVIFPPITLPPEEVISDKLLDAIRACDGVIYLRGGSSEQSFWVTLERDYALRQAKPVFSFDPASNTLTKDTSPPLSLKVFISYDRRDLTATQDVVRAMKERYFDVWFDMDIVQPPDRWLDNVNHGIIKAVHSGGYVAVMWTAFSNSH